MTFSNLPIYLHTQIGYDNNPTPAWFHCDRPLITYILNGTPYWTIWTWACTISACHQHFFGSSCQNGIWSPVVSVIRQPELQLESNTLVEREQPVNELRSIESGRSKLIVQRGRIASSAVIDTTSTSSAAAGTIVGMWRSRSCHFFYKEQKFNKFHRCHRRTKLKTIILP